MKRLPKSTIGNIHDLLRWRWLIVASTGLILIVLETIEHFSAPRTLDEYLPEVVRYGIILPILIGILLSVIDRAVAESQAKAIQDERQRIARELHDSLGQNLGYLRLKLEYLTANGTLDPEMAQELERMRAVADEAYQQIRGTLVKLDSSDSTDVAAALFDMARSRGRRAHFEVDFASEGAPFSLALNTQLAIVYIFREALVNVEKHAQAQAVRIRVMWSREGLTVKLSDDGCGFEPETASPEGHFGLRIMQERALEISAQLTLFSQPGAGTQVRLWLPARHIQSPQRSTTALMGDISSSREDSSMIKILLVDDYPLFRDGMMSVLNSQQDMEVVGQAGSGREAIEKCKSLRPDVVLLDFGLPDRSGLDTMHAILADRPETKIVFVTVHAESKLLMDAIRGGAKGYVLKDISPTEFLEFIRGVHSGKAAISPGLVSGLFEEIARLPPDPARS